ncbi:C4-type zinc ribbon domain-containing protein [Kocuria sp.]|jgi:predicted  nucleic acid-binding Zn-ribbon protein|uniref:zinc ribbon domain-containing protein n=1 Tax=Kocuria sp. TaxID=1871328 RepID=UPI002811B83E|nr:C4-type zinc ribbon domain-containing protein [Kocuria sp.]
MSTATPEQQRALLELERVDARLRRIAERIAELKNDPETARALQLRAGAIATAKELETAEQALRQRLAAAEDKVARVQASIDKDRRRLEQGGSAKDLMGLQHEIDTRLRQLAEAEEAELELMQELDDAVAHRARITPRLKEADADARRRVAARDEEGRALTAERAELAGARAAAAQAVGAPALVTRYERIRTGRGTERPAAAQLRGTSCGSCGTALSPTDAAEFRAAAADAVLSCPECGVILVRP